MPRGLGPDTAPDPLNVCCWFGFPNVGCWLPDIHTWLDPRHPAAPCSVGTVLFLGFPSLLEPPPRAGPGATRTGLAAVQACMEAVQKRMRQHDGSFLQARGEPA